MTFAATIIVALLLHAVQASTTRGAASPQIDKDRRTLKTGIKGMKESKGNNGGRDGYKQVNTVLSEAFMNLIRDGSYMSICEYNAGIPTEEDLGPICLEGLVSPDSCTRKWDRSEIPTGILAEAISSGRFKWCITEYYFGPAEDLRIDIAETDNPLQNVKAGELYGIPIDYFNALTIEMSKILHASLIPELVTVKVIDSSFEAITDAMANNECYATRDDFYRNPYRESKADFTCGTYLNDPAGHAILSLESSNIDLAKVLQNKGKGTRICVSKGSTQESYVMRDFPEATMIEIIGQLFSSALCNNECDALVDDLITATINFPTDEQCKGKTLDTFPLAAISLSLDLGAITYRAH